MRKQIVYALVFLIVFFFCDETLAQIAPAPPVKVDNITSILEKGGQFNTFIKLLQATQRTQNRDAELALRPTKTPPNPVPYPPHVDVDVAVPNGEQPSAHSGGDVKGGKFPLNVTAAGNQVNITTGVVNATVANTVYSDRRIAVYQVDQVLLPLQIFGTTPVPAPAPDVPDKDVLVPTPTPKASKGADTDSAGAVCLEFSSMAMVSFGSAVFGTIFWGL
ncbi:Transducin/WD40 repeat-like superfamily protein [Hibiscus syriacus]|uniref:Transducin/WD40 repeat-like superfamily protein n=1 Tax=Hibiscus syriacus TaxID=106335 RepID=A0A6A2Y624_HIBSY|nr:Transducin/WD40 repeat-like superfamily protein [Hibiscus syriacus]